MCGALWRADKARRVRVRTWHVVGYGGLVLGDADASIRYALWNPVRQITPAAGFDDLISMPGISRENGPGISA